METTAFTLLHSNDYHSRLTDTQAQKLRRIRDSLGANGLLLDAGDAVASGNITFRPGGEPMLDRMNQAGYDGMTVGNREFHWTRLGFHTKLSRARFPILCANVKPNRATGTEPLSLSEPFSRQDRETQGSKETDPPVRPFIVREMGGGACVVIFGLTVPMITERMLSRIISSYVFEEPLRTAQQLVPFLRSRYAPDLLVALTHIGFKQDRALAEAVPGIDLIIGGHTHVVLEQGARIGNTLVVQAGGYGRYFGRVDVQKARFHGEPPEMCCRLEDL
jgi:2',3'-cyclic-nucleotide 2'-phosphodiesterase (5'-nucleotidase family)